MEHPQLQGREYWQQVEYPVLGQKLTFPGAFLKSSATTCGISRRAPLIGEHNEEVYKDELEFSSGQLVILKEAGII